MDRVIFRTRVGGNDGEMLKIGRMFIRACENDFLGVISFV